MLEFTEHELQDEIELQIERCCAILSDTVAVIDDLTTILASCCAKANAQPTEL